jgi:hypothetical protein
MHIYIHQIDCYVYIKLPAQREAGMKAMVTGNVSKKFKTSEALTPSPVLAFAK